MIKELKKIGPKGQVVIPKSFREHLKIYPGSTVLVNVQNNKILIEKPEEDPIAIFKKIAKSMKPLKIHPHEAYEDSLKYRIKKK